MAAVPDFDRLTEWLTSVSGKAGVPNACFHLLTEDGRRVVCQAVSHSLRATHLAYGLDLKDCAGIRQALSERRAVAIDEAAADPRVAQIARRQYQLASVLYQPVEWEGRRGVLILSDRTQRSWTEADLQFAQACADELASMMSTGEAEEAPCRGAQDPDGALQHLLDAVPGQVLIVDENLYTVATSSAVEFEQDLEGQSAAVSLRELTHESDRRAEFRTALQELLDGERKCFEGLMRTVHGLWWVHASRMQSDEKKLGIQIRPGVELPEAVVRSEESRRLESLGRLAGSVAHEINNALQIVRSAIPEVGEDVTAESLRVLESGAERAGRVTSDLLTFARQRPSEIREIEIGQWVASKETLLRRLLGPSRHLDLRAPIEGCYEFDSGKLETALVNLAKNAADASPHRGAVSIRFAIESSGTGHRLRLEVIDDGEGFDIKTLPRLGEPFHSSKRFADGAGLGLSIVREIADEFGGQLEFGRAPGRGARVLFTIPVRAAGAGVLHQEQSAPLTRPASGCPVVTRGAQPKSRILVVEDEKPLQRMFQRLLEREGFEVRIASTLSSARALLESSNLSFDLALIDLTLPDGSGAALCEEAQSSADPTPVVLMSGYAAIDTLSPIFQRGCIFLSKPFGTQDLMKTVREALAGNTDPLAPTEAAS